jgi:hypothetical protein
MCQAARKAYQLPRRAPDKKSAVAGEEKGRILKID